MSRRAMGIRAKTFMALAFTLGFGLVVLVMTLRGFILDDFLQNESEEMQKALAQVTSHIDFLLDELAAQAVDYAAGEGSPHLATGGPPDFGHGRFTAARFAIDQIALAAVLDPRGALVSGTAFDPVSRIFSPLPPAFLEYLRANTALLAPDKPRDVFKGILQLGPRPLLLVSRPLLRSQAAGPNRGTLLLGRYLERELLLRMATPESAPTYIYSGSDPQLPAEVRAALSELAAGAAVAVRRPDRNTMTGYALLRDIAGRPAFVLRLDRDRSLYTNGLTSLKIFLAAFGVVILLTGGTYIMLIELTVLRPVIRLGETVQRVGAGNSPVQEIVADNPDEIGTLTGQVRDAFLAGERLKGELEEARLALERRVEERTRDLKETIDALGREIAVRQEAESQVRDLERRQRAVIDHMVSGLVTFDENLIVSRVNPAALRLMRAAPSCVGRPLGRLLPESFAADVAAAFAGAAPTVERREIRATVADGRELIVGYVLSRIPPSDGRGAQGIVLFRDLTDERRLAAEQQRLNRLTTLGEFSAQVAHELRNPLTAMSSTVQYLAASCQERDREPLRIITESIGRMDGIIRRMRLLSREMPQARIDIDLGELLAHLLLFLEASLREQGITPVFRPPARPLYVTGDPAQLHQALLNLLMNAMQAMPQGGRLRLRLARAGAPAGGGPAPVLILIADTGTGISPEVAGRIFDPFYTTREAGTGLGLPIADKIVREHGGSIRFTSRPGHGACFAVILPGAAGPLSAPG